MEFPFQRRQCFDENVADNRETARIDFVQCVLRRVPISWSDVKIDDVTPRNTASDEREVIVTAYGSVFANKDISVTQPRGGRPD